MLLGLILDLPQSHFLAIRCSCWYIVMQIGGLSNRTLKKLYIKKKKNPIAQNLSFVPNNTLVSVRRGAQERCWIKVTFHAAERVRQKIHLAN